MLNIELDGGDVVIQQNLDSGSSSPTASLASTLTTFMRRRLVAALVSCVTSLMRRWRRLRRYVVSLSWPAHLGSVVLSWALGHVAHLGSVFFKQVLILDLLCRGRGDDHDNRRRSWVLPTRLQP